MSNSYSINEAAEMLGISSSLLRKCIDQGMVDVVRLPASKHVKITPSALMRFKVEHLPNSEASMVLIVPGSVVTIKHETGEEEVIEVVEVNDHILQVKPKEENDPIQPQVS